MLSIKRVPYYRNKLFLSSVAVVTGFVMTVGIIRAVSPTDTSTHQSVLSASDRRASSLIPIKASSSETSSESGDSKGNVNAGTGSDTSLSTPRRSTSNTTNSGASSSSSGTTSLQSGSQTQSTQTSSSGSQSSGGTTQQPKPADSPMCFATILNIGLVCR